MKQIIFQQKIKHQLISKKHKKICTTLNYIEYLLILTAAVAGCVFNFYLASLLGIPIGITSSAVGLKIYTITAEIEKYKSIMKK